VGKVVRKRDPRFSGSFATGVKELEIRLISRREILDARSEEHSMPTVCYDGPYRLFFYSSDGEEPVHVHVERDRSMAKFWLDPVVLARSSGFSRSELRIVESVVKKHKDDVEKAWYEFFAG